MVNVLFAYCVTSGEIFKVDLTEGASHVYGDINVERDNRQTRMEVNAGFVMDVQIGGASIAECSPSPVDP